MRLLFFQAWFVSFIIQKQTTNKSDFTQYTFQDGRNNTILTINPENIKCENEKIAHETPIENIHEKQNKTAQEIVDPHLHKFLDIGIYLGEKYNIQPEGEYMFPYIINRLDTCKGKLSTSWQV